MFILIWACAPEQPPAAKPEPTDTAAPVEIWRSALYPEDWVPEPTESEQFLHDFSYAGYHNGEAPLPGPSAEGAFSVDSYGADPTGASDSTAAIQAAIDAASVAGGEVALGTGTYRVDGTLTVRSSGVVITGSGPDETLLAFTLGTGLTDVYHLTFRGSLTQGADVLLEADGAPLSRQVSVTDTSGLAVGDDVYLGWVITEAFVEEHSMAGTWVTFNDMWRPFFRGRILAVDSSTGTVELDVPLRYPAKIRDGASLRVVSGYLSECGVQDLAVTTVVDWEAAWSNDRSHAIGMSGVKDCWIQQVDSSTSPLLDDGRGSHLQSGGVIVLDSKRVTIDSVTMASAQNRGGGGNGYLFEISRSSEVLIRDSIARAGRHNFVQNWDFGTSGCVFQRTTSEDGEAVYDKDNEWLTWTAYSEFHHSLAMANLIDQSVSTDGWAGVNRGTYSSGAGHSATQNVFWNIQGTGLVSSLQHGMGYIIGTGEETEINVLVDDVYDSKGTAPEDYTEGLGLAGSLEPQSLYDDQLQRRLTRGEVLWP